MAKEVLSKLAKKPAQSAVVEEQKPESKLRGSTQTVRMDEELLRALKQASIERNLPQQAIIISALRRDLGL